MKKSLFLATCFFFLIINQVSLAQHNSGEPPVLPLKTSGSVLFGQDIVINNLPDQDQKNLAICSAPNGWLYAAYNYDSLGQSIVVIMRSKDQGYSWQILRTLPFLGGPNEVVKKLDILVTGTNESEHKLFMADVEYEGDFNHDFIEFHRFNCDPFATEATLMTNFSFPKHDVAIASDNSFPAIGSNPNSIGVIYSTTGTKDSIIFMSSGDGGITFNNRRVLAVTSKKFHKVALSYGRSPSQNSGRYFAAWEEQNDTASVLGNIYTSHSNPDFNSPFTTPIKLDGLDPSLVNLCRNPVIACQANNVDNDSANLSEVILFEKFNTGTGDYDVCGFYNKKAASGNTFKRLNIAASINNELQPDIRFNPFDTTFMVTYYDSTTQKLPLLNKNINLTNPDAWNVITSGYNDSNNLKYPNPKVNMNNGLNKAFTAWLVNRNTGKGSALFDAAYFPPIGIAEHDLTDIVRLVSVFPNPCNTNTTIGFELKKPEKVSVILFSSLGQTLKIITEQNYSTGFHQLKVDVSELSQGTYMYIIRAGEYFVSDKITIIR